MPRKTMAEQLANAYNKGWSKRWRQVERFDRLISVKHPPVKGRQARWPGKRNLPRSYGRSARTGRA